MTTSLRPALAFACIFFLAASGACGGNIETTSSSTTDAAAPPADAGTPLDSSIGAVDASPDTGGADTGTDSCTGGGCVGAYSIGGTVSGLSGGNLVLADNGGGDLVVTADGSFVFPVQVTAGQSYDVSVATPPSGETCYVSNPAGTVSTAAITNILVSCRSGLVAYYPFDEGSGSTILDVTGNGNNGTHDATYVSGVVGTALSFAGSQGATVIGNATFSWGDGDGDYTVDYWLMTTLLQSNWVSVFHKSDPTGENCCVGYERSPAQWFTPGTLQLLSVMATTADGNGYTQTSDFVLGQWTHFATIHSSATDTQTLYVSGVLAVLPASPWPDSQPNPQSLGSPSVGGPGILYLGQDVASDDYDGLVGELDEVRIYDVALTQAQIQMDMLR